LQRTGREYADGKPNDKRHDTEKRHIVAEDVEQWFLK